MIRSAVSFLLAASLLLAQAVQAHRVDPLELAPTAPAAGAQFEVFAGEIRELVVHDRVANATIRYHVLQLADGSRIRLSGIDARLAHGSRVEVTGRRNGRTLFVSDVRALGRTVQNNASAGETAEIEGELRMYHVDYLEEGQSRFEYDILGANDEVTRLDLGVDVDTIQRGMRVIVRGALKGDGAIDPDVVTILALPEEPADKAMQKATKTDNVLVILMRFNDSPAEPFTRAQVQAVMAGGSGSGSVAEYFKEVSFNQQLMNVTVTPWLSTGAATPAGCAWQTMGSMGRTAASAAGYATSNYHKVVYVFPRVASCGWAGLAYVGASGAWINGRNTTQVYGHELGHNFGMLHAARLDCGAEVIGGTCSVAEYGDPFNVMGNSSTMHVAAFQKADMGWIASSAIKTHTSGTATYTLSPLETAGGSAYAVKVPAAANRTYWLEYRRPIGFDAGLASYPHNGALIRVATPFETLCGGCSSLSNDTQLLDMTPATSTFTDAALLAGRSFTDTTYGITFNVLTATSTALTVQVVGPGAATTTTNLASALNPSMSGVSVAFTATVTGTAPTGNVTFTANGSTISGCSAVSLAGTGNARTATCATAALAVGSHSIVARYNGDGTNPSSTSATLSQVVNATTGSTNVALASNGATATASSTFGTGYPASSVINDERAGVGFRTGGGWKDATSGGWPDWVEVRFNGNKRIDRVVVYSVQDNWTSPVEPSATMTGSDYALTNFTVQGWNGTSWVALATVSGNALIKRTVTFAAFTTDRIRINVTSAQDGYSRMTEVEAWGQATTATTTSATLASSLNPATVGAAVTLTASVSGTAPTGSVAFTANGASITSCANVALTGTGNTRVATCTLSSLGAGIHSIVATYAGDASNLAATSAALTQVVATNVALASSGATATASSTYGTGYPAASVINNERAGAGFRTGGGWKDNTSGAWPDWVEVRFNASKRIDRVVVYSVQDNWTSPVEPSATMTGSDYVIDFAVQAWNGSTWVTLATVSGNNLIKRTVTFAQVQTDRIRINVTSAPDGYSRMTEVEAWGY